VLAKGVVVFCATSRARLLFALGLALGVGACERAPFSTRNDGSAGSGDGASTPIRDGGPRPDGSPNPIDAGPPRDGGTAAITVCSNPALTPPANGTCEATAGDQNLLIKGDIITADALLKNGHLLIGTDGKIACAACDCSSASGFASATQLACAQGVVSPGLLNAHDHITYTDTTPVPTTMERYDHRHQWRKGQDGHTRIPSVSNTGGNKGVLWGELRNVMAGATSINGSGGAPGLLRNLDKSSALQEGLGNSPVDYSTFPLGDTSGATHTSGCNYPRIDSPTDSALANGAAYTPHIAEGVNLAARNEFLCLSSAMNGGHDVMLAKTAVIHGIGLLAADFSLMKARGASLIWSPRSNIDLYGITAQVSLAADLGVRIALGSDWTATGSMNILRELRCASSYNANNLGGYFNDRELVDMATKNAAEALGSGMKLGTLGQGFEADVSIFDGSQHADFRAILDANPPDVVLVLRSGKALYGDQSILQALNAADRCEQVDVCGRSKLACVQRETGSTIADLRAAIAPSSYDLFFCTDPPNEPTCTPFRPNEFTGVPGSNDLDGDGVADDRDNCPNVFNPPRPLDMGMQADADSDGAGDACDLCPLDPATNTCSGSDPNDTDGDGVPNAMDDCPSVPNPGQEDRDHDMLGDACDSCPDAANQGGACPATIYAVKQGMATGTMVHIADALVMAVGPTGYFVQVVPGDPTYDPQLGPSHSGVFVFSGTTGMKPALGDRVDVTGTVTVYFGQTEISMSQFQVTSSGNPLPSPVTVSSAEIATGGAKADALEGVLVEVSNAMVTNVMPAPGMGDRTPTNEFEVDGALRVDDFLYLTAPFPAMGQSIPFIRGILRHANNLSKLEPRDVNDIAVAATLIGFEPSVVFAPVGVDAVPSGGFQVKLSRAATSPTAVTLTSADPAHVTVPPTVTVPMGATSADVSVHGLVAGTASIAISARLVDATVTAGVFVFDPAAQNTVASVTLDSTTLQPSASAQGAVTLASPAPAGGQQVTLTVTPSGLANVPASVTVPASTRSATFTLAAGTMTGGGTLSAKIGASGATVAFQVVVTGMARHPGPNDLVITEVMFNPHGAQPEKTREWFEVYNATTDPILLDSLAVQDNSGATGEYMISAPMMTLAPTEHAVFAFSSDMAMNGGISALVAYGTANIQLSNSADSVALIYNGMVIDRVSWASGWPGSDGRAMCLQTPYPTDPMTRDAAAAWSASIGAYDAAMDEGTPGAASTPQNCP
jgi:large repetitive protein